MFSLLPMLLLSDMLSKFDRGYYAVGLGIGDISLSTELTFYVAFINQLY